MDLGVSGLASGFDWRTLISQLIQVERQPEQRLRADQTSLQQRNNAYGSIKTQLGVLSNTVDALKDPALFGTRIAAVGDSSIAGAQASAGAVSGSYKFAFTHLATSAIWQGGSEVGRRLNDSHDVSKLALSSANFSRAVTAGTITVSGKQVTIAATDTLQAVFDNIHAATNNAVTGSYDPDSDTISLSSADEIVLGSAGDTSNFLSVARLQNSATATHTVTSSARLGSVRLDTSLDASNLSTGIVAGATGTGEFKINGKSVSFQATDTISGVLARINAAGAGVTASYDSINDRFVLANRSAGDVGIALEDVHGNFLAATGLSGGTLQRGQNLVYSINGGDPLTSQSNAIDEVSSGIAGLSVTAFEEGTTTITVSSDTTKIKSAIQNFITEYNKTQSVIDTQTASSTDASGKVTAGTLARESDADEIARSLRSAAFGQVSGLQATLDQLSDLGIDTNGNDNSLTLSDESKLDAALANNLAGVQTLFSDTTKGLAVKLSSYLNATIGDDGSLNHKQSNLTTESGRIDTQIADMERQIASSQESLTNGFLAMEQAEAKTNQQLQFLQQQFKSA